jgi:large subunit ribosomal protein L21
MFAVLKTGGKQYKVSSGDVLRVEKLDAQAGEKIQFNEILLVGGPKTVVGSPLVADAGVQAEVIEQIKGVKTINFVKRRRKHSSKRTKGHRQQLTLLRITDILAKGAKKSGVKEALSGAGLIIEKDSSPVKAEKPTKAIQTATPDSKPKIAPKAKKAPAAKTVEAGKKPSVAKAKKPTEVKKVSTSEKKPASKPASKTTKKVTKESNNGS